MASKTNFLNLILAANNEYSNSWDIPTNQNWTKVDAEIEAVSTEVQSARFNFSTLAEFLAVSHMNDGTLLPSEEMTDSRNSPVYGINDGAGGADYTLDIRLKSGDREVWDAREYASSLRESLAIRSRDFDYYDKVIDGAKDVNNQPNFLTNSGAEFGLNADPTPLKFNINGYYMVLNIDKNITVSGADGIRYLYAQKPTTAEVVVDRSSGITTSVTTVNPLNSNKIQVFKDTAFDFVNANVKVGQILEILNTDNAGEYIIDSVGFNSDNYQVKVIGQFVNSITNLNFKVKDPLRPTFGVDTTRLDVAGKCYIGEGMFTSGALTTSTAYNFKGKYESPYTSVNAIASSPSFEVILNHNLGTIPRNVRVYASQANDESLPLEPLSFDWAVDSIAVNGGIGTLSLSPGTLQSLTGDVTINNTLSLSAGDQTLNGTVTRTNTLALTGGVLPSLTGTPAATKTGTVFNSRSVVVKMTKTQIFIKGITSLHFYRDYAGTDQTTGYLKVVCEK